ncbi:hypothetical protein [Priestia megaterium]|uniref:hypothetical protein n=1 Tax=Priestia megaterium TaxID=1404 RepID=UPI003CC66221
MKTFDKDLIVRNSKTKFFFEYADDMGYVFYSENKQKGIRIREEHMEQLLQDKKVPLDFGRSGRGTYYIDYSIKEAQQKQKEYETEMEAKRKAKIELENKIDNEIKDNDTDLLNFLAHIEKSYGEAKRQTIFHKQFIYAVRHNETEMLINILGHGKGWNDVSKKFFTILTGEKLPSTKKGIIEFLKSWDGLKEEVQTVEEEQATEVKEESKTNESHLFKVNLKLDKIMFTKVEEDAHGKIIGRFELHKDFHNEGKYRLSVGLYSGNSFPESKQIFHERINGTLEEIENRLNELEFTMNIIKDEQEGQETASNAPETILSDNKKLEYKDIQIEFKTQNKESESSNFSYEQQGKEIEFSSG